MNYSRLIISLFFISIFNIAQAQTGIGQSAGQIEVNDAPGGQVKVIQSEQNLKYKGSPYLVEGWQPLIIHFKSGLKYEVTEGNFNIQSDMIEVKKGGEIHQYGSYLVKGFEFLHTGDYYLSVAAFAPSVRLGWSGFTKLLVDGETQLLTKYDITLKKAYYVPALDVGDRRDELVLSSDNYMYRAQELTLIPNKEKKFLALFDKKVTNKLKAFMEENRLNIKKEDDLIKVFRYLNEEKL